MDGGREAGREGGRGGGSNLRPKDVFRAGLRHADPCHL